MMKNLFDLAGKTAVIIGGASYLGKPMAEALAQYGANVVIASRNEIACREAAAAVSQAVRAEAVGHTVDMMDTASVKKLYADATDRFGKIDILVNNANMSTMGYVEDIDDDAWNQGLGGSVSAVYRCVREVLPYMKKNRYGKIINIASMYGQIAPNPRVYHGNVNLNNPINYGVGKAGIIQLTRYIAAYYAKDGILANALAPGSFPHYETQKNETFMVELSQKAMLGRIGRPEEVRGALVFLASDASSYVTGQCINVDGGVTAW